MTGDADDNLVSLFFEALRRLVNDHRCDVNAARRWASDAVSKAGSAGSRRDAEHFRNVCDSVARLCKVTSSPKGPMERVVSDLVKFYLNNGGCDDRMLINDLYDPDNWGLAARDGQVVPVIVDAGFSSDVARFY